METGSRNSRYWVSGTVVALGILVIYLAVHAGQRALSGEVSDFRAYYTAAAEMRADRDPYLPGQRPYLYPPLLAFLCLPLTSLPMERAALVYLPVLLLAVVASLYLAPKIMLARLGARPSAAILSRTILITLVLLFDRIKSDTQMFQVNTLMLLLFTLGLYWLDQKPWLAGSALGLALNLKGQSIVMLPYLLFRRRWAAAATMAGSAVGFALLPAAGIGWHANLANLGRLLGGLQPLAGTQAPAQSTTHLANVTAGLSISATSGVARMLKEAGYDQWLWPVVGILVAALFAYLFCLYRQAGIPFYSWPDAQRQGQPPWRAIIAMEWGGLMLATVVFNPQTNTRHLMLALLPMAFAVAALCKPIPQRAWRVMLLGAGALFAGLTLPPGNRRVAWLYELHGRWFSIGGPSWLILLALGLIVLAGLMAVRSMGTTPVTLAGGNDQQLTEPQKDKS